MNSQSILNKNSPWAHMKLDFNMFGIAGKLGKYVVHLSKKYMYIYRITSLFIGCPNNKQPVLGLKEF
jgi:hypothetical protein